MFSIRKTSGKVFVAVILITAAIFNLLFLYFLKYKNQNLSLTEFNLSATGNLLNLIFAILLILGSILYSWKKDKFTHPTLLIFLSCLMTLFLILASVQSAIAEIIPHFYLFRQPIRELLTGIFFSAFQLAQFIIISVLWLSFLDKDKLLLLRAVVHSAIFTILLILYSFYFINQRPNGEDIPVENKKAGIVLGAAVWSGNKPSPSLAARVDKAVELYKAGKINKIQLTGSNAPGEKTESEVAYERLIQNNINPYDIWVEKETTSTAEQILFTKKNLYNKGYEIIIISDSYHLKRIKEISKFYNINIKVSSSDLKFRFENKLYYKLRESIAMLVFWLFAI